MLTLTKPCPEGEDFLNFVAHPLANMFPMIEGGAGALLLAFRIAAEHHRDRASGPPGAQNSSSSSGDGS